MISISLDFIINMICNAPKLVNTAYFKCSYAKLSNVCPKFLLSSSYNKNARVLVFPLLFNSSSIQGDQSDVVAVQDLVTSIPIFLKQ